MKRILLSILVILLACSENREQLAKKILLQAQAAYEQGEYNIAKVLLDSIESAYPKCFDERKAGNILMYKINLAEEEKTLEVTSKLIEEYSQKINEVTQKNFVYEKSEYDELGRYIYKGSEVENNVQHCYIHAAVNEYGITQLISTYSGVKNINHSAIKILSSNGETISTQHAFSTDGTNYQYVIDGTHYESVTYVGNKDNGALAFISNHANDKGLKAFFIISDTSGNDRDVAVSISPKEREALAASYELGVVLAEQLRLIQQNKVAQGKIQFLKDKLNRL